MTIENDLELRQILETVKTVASVGVSSNPEKESHGIFRYLQEHGYRMIPVNPTALEILGEKAYPDLDSLPIKVEAAIRIGAQIVWMQEEVVNEQAAAQAEAAGLQVVMDRCMRKTHQRLIGE
jgi:predicted CoA-binding protein